MALAFVASSVILRDRRKSQDLTTATHEAAPTRHTPGTL